MEGALGGPAYCCSGCEVAAAIISGAGLERYYSEREALPPRPSGDAQHGWSRIPHRENADGTRSAELCIEGLRCSSCVWVTEKVLERSPGVREATVSYASGRASLRWDPAEGDLDTILGRVGALGYSPRALTATGTSPADRDLLMRLGVATFSATNVMMIAVGVYLGWFSGMEDRFSRLFQWASLTLATPAALWSAVPFYRAAWTGLRHRVLSMDLPVSIGVLLMFGHGTAATLRGEDAYLDSLTMLVALLLAGRVVEQRGRRAAASAATTLAAEAPRSARRVEGDRVVEVAPERLRVGDLVEIGAGGEIPADGVVVAGRAGVRMALLTGESEPVARTEGDAVIAGAVVQEGSLRVRVEAAGEGTLLSRMATALREAADKPAATREDRIAPWFTALTLFAATATLTTHALLSGLSAALPPTVAVLVVACPCALALAEPLARAAGLGAAARRGLLFRSGDAVLDLAEVTHIALDKTGTATAGRPVVVEADDKVLRIAAGIERNSIHPIARAIVDEAVRRGIPLPAGQLISETAGEGIVGEVDGARYTIASAGPGLVSVVGGGPSAGEGPALSGTIVLRDVLRRDAASIVAELQAEGLKVTLLTGDHKDIARRVGWAAGINDIVAGVKPDEKAAWIRARQAEGARVLFVGDGINDGPALVEASVGLAMGTGAPSSMLAADAIVAVDGLGPILAGLRAARAAAAAVRSNRRRSLVYNFSAVVAASLGLVNPLVAALLMPLSSGMVLYGATRVERRVQAAERAARPVRP
jgi:Cu2+-exporting ATPase